MEEEKKTTDVNSKPQFAIFDWIFTWPIIRLFRPIYEWKKAFWIYGFLGFVSTLANYVITIFLSEGLGLLGSVANIIAAVISTFLAFVLNRNFFFDRTNNSFINEMLKFFSGRLFTMAVEEVGVMVLVDIMHLDIKIIKALLIPVTAALNYVISKLFVFRNKKQ